MGLGIFELIVIIFLIGFIPFIIALVDIVKNEFTRNNKLIWIIVVLLAPVIGSIVYFIIGRKQKVKTSKI